MSGISDERLEQMQAQVDEGGKLNCDQELLNEIARLRRLHAAPQPVDKTEDYNNYVEWLISQAAMADEWAKKNAQWPDSFDSGHYQAQRQAFTDAKIRFLVTFKRESIVHELVIELEHALTHYIDEVDDMDRVRLLIEKARPLGMTNKKEGGQP